MQNAMKSLALGFVGLLLAFGLFACSNDSSNQADEDNQSNESVNVESNAPISQEYMASVAQDLDLKTCYDMKKENRAKYELTYGSNIYRMSGRVVLLDSTTEIVLFSDYVDEPTGATLGITVELPIGEIAELHDDEEITVVGIMDTSGSEAVLYYSFVESK